jgi:alpha-ketoglutarate-dependent taurine dioxygenase
VSVLRPTEKGAARPNSLSARYGLGQQPLHTDGAHLQRPPDLVVLFSERPSTTPTRLWRATYGLLPPPPYAALRHGMFLVHSGRDSFYSPALSASGYRYDPGCMTACDTRAREVTQYFEGQLSHASTYEWMGWDQVLVIDNRRVLHARSAVGEDDIGRELTRIAFQSEVAD